MNSIRSILAFLLIVSVVGCQDTIVDLTQGTMTTSGTIALSFDQPPPDVSRVVAKLSRRGFADNVLSLAISDSQSASGTMSNVEVGRWHLRVDAFDVSGIVKYTGETDVEVLSGQTAVVTLQLHGTSGNIEIHVTWGSNCASVTRGLISWWKAENNADDVVGSNQGLLKNGTSFTKGIVGQSFSFDGVDDYVFVPSSPTMNSPGSFTIDAWIYPDVDTSGVIVNRWRDDYGAPNQRIYLLSMLPGGNLRFAISDSAHQKDSAFHIFDTHGGVLHLRSWNHVAFVYDYRMGTRRIFVNGTQVAERTDPPITILPGYSDLLVGAILEPGTSRYFAFFPGMIDELSLYNRALRAPEIQSIYLAGSAGKCK